MIEWIEMITEQANQNTGKRLTAIAAQKSENSIDQYVAIVCQGVALSIEGKLKEGLVELQRAILLEPREWDAHFWKGMICAYLGRNIEAIEAIKKSLDVDLPPILLGPLRWLEKDRPEFFEKYAAPLLKEFEV